MSENLKEKWKVMDFLPPTHNVATLSKSIGYVYQDFENQLLRPTVIDDASFVPLNYGLEDFKERGEWALRVTGLNSFSERVCLAIKWWTKAFTRFSRCHCDEAESLNCR